MKRALECTLSIHPVANNSTGLVLPCASVLYRTAESFGRPPKSDRSRFREADVAANIDVVTVNCARAQDDRVTVRGGERA
ncbi:hypothetical protein EVAR_89516_1 [Eumeta japonica]|uniref:Uncharacterized protein n=1 Tax=Eumeta variegata TaxID=151549 RepID=A0A4C1Y987_EUMVA|nr:hypothetical protein EVAR_89516_1 [Eumeta japonica]